TVGYHPRSGRESCPDHARRKIRLPADAGNPLVSRECQPPHFGELYLHESGRRRTSAGQGEDRGAEVEGCVNESAFGELRLWRTHACGIDGREGRRNGDDAG